MPAQKMSIFSGQSSSGVRHRDDDNLFIRHTHVLVRSRATSPLQTGNLNKVISAAVYLGFAVSSLDVIERSCTSLRSLLICNKATAARNLGQQAISVH